MKTLKKIKLNEFSKNVLDQRKLNALRGGITCNCYSTCYCNCTCNLGLISSDMSSDYRNLNGYTYAEICSMNHGNEF